MGIADAGVDMMPQSAAPATKLIARAFTGHLPIVGARPVQARQPRAGVDSSDFLDWPKAQIDQFPLAHTLGNLPPGKLRVTFSSVVHAIMNPVPALASAKNHPVIKMSCKSWRQPLRCHRPISHVGGAVCGSVGVQTRGFLGLVGL
jgi:hypothetical protein